MRLTYIYQISIPDGELTIDDKYKKTLEEIEALKDHLGKLVRFCLNYHLPMCASNILSRATSLSAPSFRWREDSSVDLPQCKRSLQPV